MAAPGRSNARAVAIAALAAGLTQAEAAERAGVSERTLRRWLKDPEFAQALADAQAQAGAEVLKQVTAAITAAVDTLQGLLQEESPSIRLQAAKALLVLWLKIRESVVLEERVRRLEVRLDAATDRFPGAAP